MPGFERNDLLKTGEGNLDSIYLRIIIKYEKYSPSCYKRLALF